MADRTGDGADRGERNPLDLDALAVSDRFRLFSFTRAHDKEQVYRRLSRPDTVLDDMSRRAAQFHLTLGEITRSADTSPAPWSPTCRVTAFDSAARVVRASDPAGPCALFTPRRLETGDR